MTEPESAPLWAPSAERVALANLTRFMAYVRRRGGNDAVVDFASLYRWSVDRPAAFWLALLDFCEVIAEGVPDEAGVVRGLERMAPPDPAAEIRSSCFL